MIKVEKAISIERARTITKGKTQKRKKQTNKQTNKHKTKQNKKQQQQQQQQQNKQTNKRNQNKTKQNKKTSRESNPCISFIVTSFINAPTIWAKSPVVSIAAVLSICINWRNRPGWFRSIYIDLNPKNHFTHV